MILLLGVGWYFGETERMYILAIVFALILLIVILSVVVILLFNRKQLKNQRELHQNKASSFGSYKTDRRAVVISCYFNPQKSPYRRTAFHLFYEKIKHLEHRIIECVIGDAQPELPENQNIKRIYTQNLLWHKEAILNKIVSELPPQYEYVFWVDADVIFENNEWLTKGVEELQNYKIIQPFEYCVHLDRDQTSYQGNKTLAEVNQETKEKILAGERVEDIRIWQSFCAAYREQPGQTINHYDLHGHVGFAWGARREVLEKVPLYDRALIGGADHIIAHAAVGQIPHECITKAFSENIEEVLDWSKRFYQVVETPGKVGFVKGNLLHIWHGELVKRDYLRRIQVSAAKIKEIRQKDKNGLYETDDDSFVHQYFQAREVQPPESEDYFDSSSSSDYANRSDYFQTSESRDYFQSETVDFVGGGAGGSWEEAGGGSLESGTAGASVSASMEAGSTFS